MWPFFHKSFEEYFCGLFVAKLGSELSSVSSPAYAPPLASDRDRSLLCTRLLRHLLPNAPHDPLSFFVGLLKSSYWSAVLEFAACEGGAAWLLSIYRPTLLAKLPSVKDLQFSPAAAATSATATLQPSFSAFVSGASAGLSTEDERVFFSREGVLLMMCALDSAEATRRQAIELLTKLAGLDGVTKAVSTTTFHSADSASTNAFLYCAAQNRADYLALLLQLFPNAPRVQLRPLVLFCPPIL